MKLGQYFAGKQPAAPRGLMRVASIFGLLGCAAGTSANAATFNGPYLGADIGYEDSGRIDHGGITYGAFAGYDLKVGPKVVVGGEARIGDSSINHTVTRTNSAFTTVARASIGRHVGASARLGFLAGPRTLLYARAGWENVKVRATTTRTPLPPTTDPAPVISDFSFDDDTSVLGLGVEHAVHDRLRVRMGYDYAENFDRHQLRIGVVAGF